eukprot:15471083-Alexandrium_andersonii.AAC.1
MRGLAQAQACSFPRHCSSRDQPERALRPTAQSFGRRAVRWRSLLSGAVICGGQWTLLERGRCVILQSVGLIRA